MKKECNMKSRWLLLALSSLALAACQNSNAPKIETHTAEAANALKADGHTSAAPKKEIRKQADDLNALKQEFISSILEANVDESPFDLYYTFRTVFFSNDIVSFFGEANVYDQDSNWEFFEAKTYYKNNGKFTPITLDDLFVTTQQKDFLKNYIEQVVTANKVEACNPIEQNYLQNFTLTDKSLLVVLQPKVGVCDQEPLIVSLPFESLKDQWKPDNPIAKTLPQVLESKSYTSGWDEDQFFLEG
jgi:lipopolysaccharide export LptBFGC system permease protein LptF